jgi:hypothetical protein
MTNTKKESLNDGLRDKFEQNLKDFLKQRFNLEYKKEKRKAKIGDITIELSRGDSEDVLEVYNKEYKKNSGLGFFISYNGDKINDEIFNFSTGSAADLLYGVNDQLGVEDLGKNAYYAFDIIEGLVKNLLNKK